jgi:S1-C subfamily serine protease
MVLTVIAPRPGSAQSDGVFFQKNGWTGAILSGNSGLVGCLASTSLTDRMKFGLIRLPAGQWFIVFSKPGGYERGLRWEMDLHVDGRPIHKGVVTIDKSGLALFNPPLSERGLAALSTGRKFEIVTVRGRFEYSLGGSGDAIAAASRCGEHVATLGQSTGSISSGNQPPKFSSGTGFFVTLDGKVLTNAHVIEGCRSIGAGAQGSAMQSAHVLARDTKNDLALLGTSMRPSKVPQFKPSVRTGDPIAVYGFPLAGYLPSTGNFTLGNVTATAGPRDDTRILQISAPVQGGNSGGPLLDVHGNIAGVVVARLNAKDVSNIPQNVNFALKASVAAMFLEANGVRVGGSATSEMLSSADLADVAKSFTVFIACQS